MKTNSEQSEHPTTKIPLIYDCINDTSFTIFCPFTIAGVTLQQHVASMTHLLPSFVQSQSNLSRLISHLYVRYQAVSMEHRLIQKALKLDYSYIFIRLDESISHIAAASGNYETFHHVLFKSRGCVNMNHTSYTYKRQRHKNACNEYRKSKAVRTFATATAARAILTSAGFPNVDFRLQAVESFCVLASHFLVYACTSNTVKFSLKTR